MIEIYIVIENDIFEVSRFVPNHPGEAIRNVYLR